MRNKKRKQRDNYFMSIALLTKTRATCNRLKVGAVLVRDKRIIMSGYNGSPSGMAHCEDVGCLIDNKHCIRTLHAEENIIIQCAKHGIAMNNSILYVTHEPCFDCMKMLISCGISEIIYYIDYPDKRNKLMIFKKKIKIRKLKEVNINEY